MEKKNNNINKIIIVFVSNNCFNSLRSQLFLLIYSLLIKLTTSDYHFLTKYFSVNKFTKTNEQKKRK